MGIQGKSVWFLLERGLTGSVPGILCFVHGLDRVREGVCPGPGLLGSAKGCSLCLSTPMPKIKTLISFKTVKR